MSGAIEVGDIVLMWLEKVGADGLTNGLDGSQGCGCENANLFAFCRPGSYPEGCRPAWKDETTAREEGVDLVMVAIDPSEIRRWLK